MVRAYADRKSLPGEKAVADLQLTIESIQESSPIYLASQHKLVTLLAGIAFLYLLWATVVRVFVLRYPPLLLLEIYRAVPPIRLPLMAKWT